jgi:hypothetical protein
MSVGRRSLRWAVFGVLVGIIGLAAGFKPAWDERPPEFVEDRWTVRLEGSCCSRMPAGRWQYGVPNEDRSQIAVSVEFTSLETERTSVRDGRANFSYSISRLDAGQTGSEMVQEIYHATDLSVGDTVTQGPVTIEVVAIYDLFFNRNNAVDLRVTFDESRLDEAP